MNHSPTRAARRVVIHRVESEYERFDCISDMHKFGVNCAKCNNFCEPKLQLKSWPGTDIVDVGHGRLYFCSVHVFQTSPNCKGVICQTKFGISDDADVSSQSGSVTVLERQSC